MSILAEFGIDGAPRVRSKWRLSSLQALALAAIGLALLRFYFAASTGLTNDETYYRLWSLRPSLSYYDHPPLIAWLIAMGRAIAGDTPLGVRSLGPLLLLLGSLIQWWAAYRLTDAKTAIFASWFFLAMPLLAIGGVIMTPDVPSVLFYGLVLISIDALERSQNPNYWYAIGLFSGFGLLAKYTNLFAGLTVVIWLLAVPGNLKWIKFRQFWLAGAIALLIFSPVLIWNFNHDWASFVKQFGRIPTGHVLRAGFLVDLAICFTGLASPIIALLAVLGLGHVTSRAVRYRDSHDVLLAAAILPMLGYFLVHAMHARVMPNWPSPLYPALAICAAIGLRNFISPGLQLSVAAIASVLGFALTSFILVHAMSPMVALQRDPTGEMRGWSTFKRHLEDEFSRSEASWIVTSDFQTESQLSFAFRGSHPVVQITEQIRYENLPRVPAEILSKPALYVDLARLKDSTLVLSCFNHTDRLGNLARADGTRSSAEYAIYLVSGFRPSCRSNSGFGAER